MKATTPDSAGLTNPQLQNFDCGKHPMVQVQSNCPWCEIEQLRNELTAARLENQRLQEVLTIPNITPDTTSSALFIRTLSEHEKGQPVNGQDLINALMWRVKNQRKEIARLQEKRGSSEPGAAQDTIRYRWLRDWILREGRRAEIDPDGHIAVRTLAEWEALLDTAIARGPAEKSNPNEVPK